MTHRFAQAAAAGLLLVGLSACGGQEADAEATASSYDGIDDLRTSLNEAGVDCREGEVSQQEGYEAQACGNGFYITHYTEDAMRTAQVDKWSTDEDMATAAGTNWAVRAKNAEEIQQVAEQLDGEVVSGETATESAEPSGSASAQA